MCPTRQTSQFKLCTFNYVLISPSYQVTFGKLASNENYYMGGIILLNNHIANCIQTILQYMSYILLYTAFMYINHICATRTIRVLYGL